MCRRFLVPVALAVSAAAAAGDVAVAKPGLLHKRGPATASAQVAPRLAVSQPAGPLPNPEAGDAADASLPVMPMPAPLDGLGPDVADDGMVSIMPLLPPPVEGWAADSVPGSAGLWSAEPGVAIGSAATGIVGQHGDQGPAVTSSVVTVVTGVHPIATPLESAPFEALDSDGNAVPLMAMTTAGVEQRTTVAGGGPTGRSSAGGASAGRDLVDGQSGLTRVADPRLQAVPRATTPAPRWRDRIRFASPFGD